MSRLDEMQHSGAASAVLHFDVVDRLNKSLRHSGVGVGEMADYLGVNRNTVGRYLSGRSRADLRTLRSWAELTGYPLQWLQTGTVTDPTDPSLASEPTVTEPHKRWHATLAEPRRRPRDLALVHSATTVVQTHNAIGEMAA